MSSLLEEKDAIREVMARYCFHTDGGDAEKFASLFVDDCVWDGGPFGVQIGAAALLAMVKGGAEVARTMRHLTTNIVIDVRGDEAHAKSYVSILGVGQPPPSVFFVGHYIDHLVKRDGQWKFKTRKVRPDASEGGHV